MYLAKKSSSKGGLIEFADWKTILKHITKQGFL